MASSVVGDDFDLDAGTFGQRGNLETLSLTDCTTQEQCGMYGCWATTHCETKPFAPDSPRGQELQAFLRDQVATGLEGAVWLTMPLPELDVTDADIVVDADIIEITLSGTARYLSQLSFGYWGTNSEQTNFEGNVSVRVRLPRFFSALMRSWAVVWRWCTASPCGSPAESCPPVVSAPPLGTVLCSGGLGVVFLAVAGFL